MNNKQLAEALKIAKSDQDLSNVDIEILDGYGLPDFQKVTVDILAVARTIRLQCFRLNGTIDADELNDLANHFRHKVSVLCES